MLSLKEHDLIGFFKLQINSIKNMEILFISEFYSNTP